MHAIHVRRATLDDVEELTDFNVAMAKETERRELARDTVSSGVKRLFARPEAGFYWVAEIDDLVVGSLLVTFEWSDWRDGFFWWIQSVYVRPGARRRGVFRQLFQRVQAEARSRHDVCGLRLYVEHENRTAQQTYATLGMYPTPYQIYECPVDNGRTRE